MSTTENHANARKTPVTTVILAIVIPVVALVLLFNIMMSSNMKVVGNDPESQEAVASRIQPIAGFALVDTSGPKVLKTGQQVYDSTCAACHNAGVAGAPIFGNADAWAPVIAKGYETLVKNALNGINAMPARGGNPTLADIEIERAIVLMANKAGASFPEPKEPEGEGAEPKAAQ